MEPLERGLSKISKSRFGNRTDSRKQLLVYTSSMIGRYLYILDLFHFYLQPFYKKTLPQSGVLWLNCAKTNGF